MKTVMIDVNVIRTAKSWGRCGLNCAYVSKVTSKRRKTSLDFFQILTGVASFVLWEMEMNNYDGDIEQNNVKRGVDWDGQKSFEY